MNIDFTLVVTAEAQATAALSAAKATAGEQILSAINALTEAMTGRVPLAEMLSWSAKEAAARAFADGKASEAEVALIAGEAAETGEDEATLVARILANADAYRGAIATLTGLRRAAEAAIEGAADAAMVEAALAEVLERLQALGKSLLA